MAVLLVRDSEERLEAVWQQDVLAVLPLHPATLPGHSHGAHGGSHGTAGPGEQRHINLGNISRHENFSMNKNISMNENIFKNKNIF